MWPPKTGNFLCDVPKNIYTHSPALYEYCSERSPATTEPEEEEEDEEEEDEKEDAAEEEEEEEGVLASRRTASDLKSNVFGVQKIFRQKKCRA